MGGNTSVPGRVPEPRPAHVLHVVCHQPYMSSVISKRFISLGSSSNWHLPVCVECLFLRTPGSGPTSRWG
jgi:hypothetical protein